MILTPNEVAICQLALQTLLEDNENAQKNTSYPFTPEARKALKEMNKAASSALNKIIKVSGHNIQLDPYKEGDEKEFLTKES